MIDARQDVSVHGLPSGVVTFLLTDIEGSTPAWEADATAMARAVARHDSILSDAAARHGGVRPVEQGEGDSMVIAFEHATDAVAAALEAQQALWSEMNDHCRVRMALHSGEALVRFDVDTGAPRYAGRAIIATARLRSTAHGGQVVVSSTTASLVADALPDGASLLPLGTVSLRGLASPEAVLQLVHPAIPAGFASLRELATPPHSVPNSPASFLGREHDLDQLGTLTAEQRLVTITGTGGVGKTRLAQHLALDLVDQSGGSVWWVELAPATTTEGVLAAVAEGMRLSLAPGIPALSQFVRHLGTGTVIVVFDNCEHVVEQIGDLVVELLAAAPNLRVVTTSREPLGLPGEHVWRVASLSVPPSDRPLGVDDLLSFDSARLFVDRAKAARPNLVVDAAAIPHVVAICERLDGVALAIELAAARARAMPLDALARALDDSFRILTGGSRTLMPRQQTLLASIGWSVEMLAPSEQAALRRLAICPGPFDLDAAEAIAADDQVLSRFDVLDALIALVDKSLVEFVPQAGSYRMLETIRQFALDRLLAAGEVAATRRRHAEHWAVRIAAIEAWRVDTAQFVRAQLADVFAMLDWAMTEDHPMAERVLGSAGWVFGFGRWDELPRACAFLAVDGARSDAWPSAVAMVCTMAPLAGLLEIFAVVPRALDQATAAGDRAAVHLLSLGEVYGAITRGDPAPAAELFEASMAEGHTAAAFYAGTAAVSLLAAIGQLSAAERICRWVRDVSRVDGGIDETAAGAAFAHVDNHRGLFSTDDIPERIDSWAMVSNQYAEAAALRAVYTGDSTWLQRAARLCKSDVGAWADLVRAAIDWATAVLDDDLESALEVFDDSTPAPGDVSRVISTPLRGATQAALGRWADVVATVGALDELRRWIPAESPALHSAQLLLAARAAHAAGDRAAADSNSHDALVVAVDAGLRLGVIDALETVAAVHGDPVRAARLAAAASADRERCGYVTRLWSGLDVVAASGLKAAHPDAWAEGCALDLDGAVALARRQRGPRGRPSFGTGSLTPTEQLVADHLTSGETNAEIAAALLISVATVKTHVTRIFTKLGVRNRAELVALLHRQS